MSSIQFLIGKTLGKYEILEHIGHGGMAEVYKGRQRQLNRMVAIKILHPFLADEEGFVARFRREAHIVAAMRHPNIVQVYDFDYDETLAIYYMVMEYIEGPTLKDRLANGPLTIPEAIEIGASIAEALDYAHHQGMVHRDIKPANIMFLPTGSPVLTDFGIARMLTLSGLTASGAMVGTPAYMAPEIATGEPAGAASDLYSLSVVLYQTITGQLPFTAETPMGMVMQHINQSPIPPSRHAPHIPPGLEEVILRGLAKQPSKRFKSAAEMAAALRRLQNGTGPKKPSLGSLTGLPTAVPQVAPVAAESHSPSIPLDLSPSPDGVSEPHQAATAAKQDPGTQKPRLWVRFLLMALVAFTFGVALFLRSNTNLIPSETAPLASPTTSHNPVGATPLVPTASPPPTRSETPASSLPQVSTRVLMPTSTSTPTVTCNLRAKTELVRIEPGTTVAPGTAFLTYVTLRNTGNCPWPADMSFRFSEGDSLGALESFPLKTLSPREIIQVLIPMTAPVEPGSYRSTWEIATGDRQVGSRVPIEIEVADIPTPTPKPIPATDLSPPTLEPLTVLTPTLVTWTDDPAQGQWQATVHFLAQGGNGSYRYFLNVVRAEDELPNGELTFEWKRCEPFPVNLWVLAGGDAFNWRGEIPFPAMDRCP